MSGRTFGIALILFSQILLSGVRGADADEGKVRVTVVSILATSKNNTVDDRLKEIAREVRKKMPELTGFGIATTSRLTMTLGTKETFAAVEENEVTIEAKICKENADRYCLQINAPTLALLKYTCVSGKYFPIVTGYETRNGDRLIIAVMVEKGK